MVDVFLAMWSLGFGALSGFDALIPGFADLTKLKERFIAPASRHAALMGLACLLFFGSFILRPSLDATRVGTSYWTFFAENSSTSTASLLVGDLEPAQSSNKFKKRINLIFCIKEIWTHANCVPAFTDENISFV